MSIVRRFSSLSRDRVSRSSSRMARVIIRLFSRSCSLRGFSLPNIFPIFIVVALIDVRMYAVNNITFYMCVSFHPFSMFICTCNSETKKGGVGTNLYKSIAGIRDV